MLPLGIIGTIYIFSNAGEPALIKQIVKKQKDTLVIEVDTSALGKLNAYVDSVNNSPQLFSGNWSFYLIDVDSGNVIADVNIDQNLVPASVMKIVSTGTALSILGPYYRFSTRLQYDGTIDKATRTLNGNIYIKGSGDPSLGAKSFGSSIEGVTKTWVNAIKYLDIDTIKGAIIADAESCDANPIPNEWTWGDIQSDYGAGTCGLNIRENVYDLIFSGSKEAIYVRTSPEIPNLKLYNRAIYNSAVKPYAYVQGAPFQFERVVFGEVQKDYVERAIIPDPALLCAQHLKKRLSSTGIYVEDSVATSMRLLKLNHVKTNPKKDRRTIAKIFSPSLKALVHHTNHASQNFYAESILRAISLNDKGYGNSNSSINNIYGFWKKQNLDLRGLLMVDGCGLSRMNTISTHQLVDMLAFFAKDTIVFEPFYNSLPIAGETGTLKNTAKNTSAHGNIHAKSGTMGRVKSYAGYVKTKSEKLLCFAVIGNNTLWSEKQLKGKFERLFALMAELP